MVLEILGYILSVWLIDLFCENFLGWSPLSAIRGWFTHRKALSPSERDRLLALEDAEADKMMTRAEAGDRPQKKRQRRQKSSEK